MPKPTSDERAELALQRWKLEQEHAELRAKLVEIALEKVAAGEGSVDQVVERMLGPSRMRVEVVEETSLRAAEAEAPAVDVDPSYLPHPAAGNQSGRVNQLAHELDRRLWSRR